MKSICVSEDVYYYESDVPSAIMECITNSNGYCTLYADQYFLDDIYFDDMLLEEFSEVADQIYDNITNDMEFENNVKMFYLENKIFAEKANFINSENYLFVENNVVAEAPEGNLVADKLNFDLNEKKLRISMYNDDKVNIKVNY